MSAVSGRSIGVPTLAPQAVIQVCLEWGRRGGSAEMYSWSKVVCVYVRVSMC